MATILNVHLPGSKHLFIALQRIKGIGWARSKLICKELNLDPNMKAELLTDAQEALLSNFLERHQVFLLEDNLRRTLLEQRKLDLSRRSQKEIREERLKNKKIRG